jgi:hypothetical protein
MDTREIHKELLLLNDQLTQNVWPPGEGMSSLRLNIACSDLLLLIEYMDDHLNTLLVKQAALALIYRSHQELDYLYEQDEADFPVTQAVLTHVKENLRQAIKLLLYSYHNLQN